MDTEVTEKFAPKSKTPSLENGDVLSPELEALDLTRDIVSQKKLLNLVTSINNFNGQENPNRLPSLRSHIPFNIRFLIPALASSISSTEQEEAFLFKPTAREFKKVKPAVASLSRIIGFFSKRLANRFDKYVETKGLEVFNDITQRSSEMIGALEKIEDPKKQFLKELSGLYRSLAEPLKPGENFRRLSGFVRYLDEIHLSEDDRWEKDLPFIGHFRRLVPVLIAYRDNSKQFVNSDVLDKVDTAAPEILRGMARFLRSHGLDIPDIHIPNSSLGHTDRGLAEVFAKSKLRRVEEKLPDVLEAIYNLLPENGPDFAVKVRSHARKIVSARKNGASEDLIFNHLFQNL